MQQLSTEHPSLVTALDLANVRLRLLRYRPFAAILAIGAAVQIGALAYWLRLDHNLTVIYLAPVVLAAWWLGSTSAALVAIAASLVLSLVTHALRPGMALGVEVWDGLTTLVLFLATGLFTARVRRSQQRLAEATLRLATMVDRERWLARTDPQTSLPNFRALLEHLRAEIVSRRRQRRPLFIAYIDVDDFKVVNDRHGHAAGNELLASIATAIRECVRSTDTCARVGGDEFAVVFTDARALDVQRIAQRIAQRVREVGGRYVDARVGASVGIARLDAARVDVDEALRCADRAMYAAKAAGKGRLFCFDARDATLREVSQEDHSSTRTTTTVMLSRPPLS